MFIESDEAQAGLPITAAVPGKAAGYQRNELHADKPAKFQQAEVGGLRPGWINAAACNGGVNRYRGVSATSASRAHKRVRRVYCAVISQTTPQLLLQLPWPPNSAVPHRLPEASMATGLIGPLPSLPLKS